MRLKFLLITLCCLASVQLSAQKANTSNTTDNTSVPKDNAPQATNHIEIGCVLPVVKKKLPDPIYQQGNSVDGLVLQGDFLRRHPTRMK